MIYLSPGEKIVGQAQAATNVTVTIYGRRALRSVSAKLDQREVPASTTDLFVATGEEVIIDEIHIANPSGPACWIKLWHSGTTDPFIILPETIIQWNAVAIYNANGWNFYPGPISAHGSESHSDRTNTFWLPIDSGVVQDGGTLATRGTMPNALRVITLADAVTAGCSWVFTFPEDYIANGALGYEIYHAGQTTTTGIVRWNINTVAADEGASIVAGAGTATLDGQAPTTVDLLVKEALVNLGYTANPGAILRLSVRREGGHANDTYAASTSLIGVRVHYTAKQ